MALPLGINWLYKRYAKINWTMQNNVSAILCNNKEPLRHLAFKILDDPCSWFLTRIKPQENSLVAVFLLLNTWNNGYIKDSAYSSKGIAMRQGDMCATTLIVVLPPWHTLPRKSRKLNGRGHLAMKLSVGGTQSLNATCKLLIAEKTFYIFGN